MTSRRDQIKEGLRDWINQYKEKIDTAQDYADIVGMIPGVGNIVDYTSAGLDVAQGDYGDAAVRAMQGVPIVGIPTALAGGYVKDKLMDYFDKPSNAYKQYGQSMFAGKPKDDTNKDTDKDTGEATGSLLANMYNTRRITPGGFSSFRESTEVLNEAIPFIKLLRGKKGKVADENKAAAKGIDPKDISAAKAGEKIQAGKEFEAQRRATGYDPNTLLNRRGKLLPGMALAGLGLGATIAVPKIFGGSDSVETAGQPLSVGAHSGSAPANTFDRLQSLSSFIPQYNPAGFALNALSNRITGQIR